MKSLFVLLLASLSFLTTTARAAQNTVLGKLLLEAKAQVEVYHNGKAIPIQNQADAKKQFQFRVEIPARSFKVGDVIVLRVLSPYVYRAIVAAIDLSDRAGQIAIKRKDWRFLGSDKNATKINAVQFLRNTDIPAKGTPDGNGISEREKLGIIPEANGGSEWVKSKEHLTDWYCIGFVLTPDVLKNVH